MSISKTLVEFQLDNNVVYVTRKDYLNRNRKKITEYDFSYGTLSSDIKSTNFTHKSIGGAMKKFNKAVNAIKNGTNIK